MFVFSRRRRRRSYLILVICVFIKFLVCLMLFCDDMYVMMVFFVFVCVFIVVFKC